MSKDDLHDRATCGIGSGVLDDLRRSYGDATSRDKTMAASPHEAAILGHAGNRRTRPLRGPRFSVAHRNGRPTKTRREHARD